MANVSIFSRDEEAINILSGSGEESLRHVSLFFGAHMLDMARAVPNITVGYETLTKLLDSKIALAKFKEFILAQGGNANIIDNPKLLPQAKIKVKVVSTGRGFIQIVDAAEIGNCTMRLGAGREYKGQEIDFNHWNHVGTTNRCVCRKRTTSLYYLCQR